MRTAQRVWSGIAAGVVGLAAVNVLGGGPAQVAASTSLASASVDDEGPARTSAVVTDVIGGDTFVADGQVVRVLGISSCDVSTPGGREAKHMAESMLGGRQVVLRAQRGVDRDAAGRLLRYVDLAGGGDYGDFMVAYPHTRADASTGADRATVANLRDDDSNGRVCS